MKPIKEKNESELKAGGEGFSRLGDWSGFFVIAALIFGGVARIVHCSTAETVAEFAIAAGVFGEVVFHKLAGKHSNELLRRWEDKLRSRRLSNEQREAIREAISEFSETLVNVVSAEGDRESKRFAEDFVEVFTASGWRASASTAGRSMGVGLMILVVETEGPLALAAASLQRVFSEQKLDDRPVIRSGGSGGHIDMLVGLKATATISAEE